MRVAITMATYNGVEWLKNVSIPSVLKQTHKDFVLFICHDGFEEDKFNETYEAVDDFFDKRISFSACERPAENPWNTAGYVAVNNCLDRIKTHNEWCDIANAPEQKFTHIFHLDQDDYWYPHHIETLLKALEENPDADLAYAKVHHYENNMFSRFLGTEFDSASLLRANYIAHSSIAYKVDAEHDYYYSGDPSEPSDYRHLKSFLHKSNKDFKFSPEVTVKYFQRCSIEYAKRMIVEK